MVIRITMALIGLSLFSCEKNRQDSNCSNKYAPLCFTNINLKNTSEIRLKCLCDTTSTTQSIKLKRKYYDKNKKNWVFLLTDSLNASCKYHFLLTPQDTFLLDNVIIGKVTASTQSSGGYRCDLLKWSINGKEFLDGNISFIK
jgi:hypothetical protein